MIKASNICFINLNENKFFILTKIIQNRKNTSYAYQLSNISEVSFTYLS